MSLREAGDETASPAPGGTVADNLRISHAHDEETMVNQNFKPDRGIEHPLLLNPVKHPDEYIRKYLPSLPRDRDELVEIAKQRLIAYHEIREAAGDDTEARLLALQIEAVVWRLNQNTPHGSWEERRWLVHQLEAPDGEVPIWGQNGRFLVRAMGIRFLVDYRGLDGRHEYLTHSFGVHIVDVLRPFISGTGYHSFSGGCSYENGGTVDQAVAAAITEYMTSKQYLEDCGGKRILLNEVARNHCLEQQAKDPAFGPDGWIKVADVPFFSGTRKPKQMKLPIASAPRPAALTLHRPAPAPEPQPDEEDYEDYEDDEEDE